MITKDSTYVGLINLRSRLEAKHTQLKRDLDVISKQLESVSVTLELIEVPDEDGHVEVSSAPGPESGEVKASDIDVASLQGMTQVEALKKLAQHYGGQFYTTVAKQILLQAGLIKNPKNANNIIFGIIQRSGAFERVGPGHYRLSTKPTPPERVRLN